MFPHPIGGNKKQINGVGVDLEKLLNPQEVATLLGVKTSTIYQWTHQDFIPHVKLGRLLRFKEAEIITWIDKRTSPGRKTRKLSPTDLNL